MGDRVADRRGNGQRAVRGDGDAELMEQTRDATQDAARESPRRRGRFRRRVGRLSTQMYLGIIGAALMTVAASGVGLYSFNRLGGAVTQVNEGSVPDMSAAFDVGLTSGALASVGGQLTSTRSSAQFERLVENVDQARNRLQAELDELEEREVDPQLFGQIRRDVDTLILNIDGLKASVRELFVLQTRIDGVQRELEALTERVDAVVIPAIDDQIFFVVTGYMDLGSAITPREEHLSLEEVDTYQRLAQLQGEAALASQILASAFSLSSVEEVEPLRERFLAVKSKVEGNLLALEGHPIHRELDDLFTGFFHLGLGDELGEERTFDLVAQLLTLTESQRDLVNVNRNIAIRLLNNVDTMAAGAQARAQEAATESTQAIGTGRTLLLTISAIAVVGALLTGWLLIGRSLLRRLEMLSGWMRQMAGGNLEARADVGGHDEVTEMAEALEVFRRHALEVQRLNLVEQLAQDLQGKNDELERVLGDLQKAQDQIVTQEKLAALGELTAGVAHEIRNPLNFVKNFSEASNDLLAELRDIVNEDKEFTKEDKSYVLEVSGDLESNLERVLSHTARADRIVEDMLKMGRSSTARQPTDMNLLIEEYARLAYHSARATDSEVQLHMEFDLDESLGEMEVLSQDMGRVFLNMVSNACYAANEKRQSLIAAGAGSMDFIPTVWISTRREDGHAVIRLRDNGTGMPAEVQEKIFNPFFTTKPTDKGTGLGLAISSDIIRGHGGSIEVESEPDSYTEMKIVLPLADSMDGVEESVEPEESEAAEAPQGDESGSGDAEGEDEASEGDASGSGDAEQGTDEAPQGG